MGRIAMLRQLVQRRTSNLYDTWFTRRVSIYLTALFYKLGWSANAVSYLGAVVGIAAWSLIAFADGYWVLAGVALVHLYAVLDSVDGELARLRQRFTLLGLFLEDLSAFTMINGSLLAVACYLMRREDIRWPMVLAVAAVAFGRNAMAVARRAVFKSITTRRPVGAPAEPRAPGGLARLRELVDQHLLHFTNVWITLTTLIAIETCWDVHLVRYAFAAYTCAILAKEAAAIALFVFTGALEAELMMVYSHAQGAPQAPVDPVN